tara:strand:- start:5770 stop:6498 length:729 start_codon:yes stop_codon:yes gene_type:complete
MQSIAFLYNTFRSNKKERFGIILEPLQALLQLALLSFTPIESKLTINNNILFIQPPNWNQSVVRSYYNDSKNDLFYLFNVFIRFNKFYQHLKDINNNVDETSQNNVNLFNLLKEMATKGLDNLLQTYKQTDNPALLHTLNIYKNLLNNPEQQLSIEQQNQYSNVVTYDETRTISQNGQPDIDSVFVNITKLYSQHDLIIILNTLQLINKYPNNYIDYTEGLNKLLEPINKQIQKWIVDNIVY